jgi:hypothetical protein
LQRYLGTYILGIYFPIAGYELDSEEKYGKARGMREGRVPIKLFLLSYNNFTKNLK